MGHELTLNKDVTLDEFRNIDLTIKVLRNGLIVLNKDKVSCFSPSYTVKKRTVTGVISSTEKIELSTKLAKHAFIIGDYSLVL